MNNNDGLKLVAPRVTPALDPLFRPAVLANRAFRERVQAGRHSVPVGLALEQTGGSVSQFHTEIFPETDPSSAGNFRYLERLVRLLLWSRGGFRLHFEGPPHLAAKLAAYYREAPTG